MSPDEQGWAKCVKCGAWRLPGRDGKDAVRVVEWVTLPGDKVAQGHECADELLCRRLAERRGDG